MSEARGHKTRPPYHTRLAHNIPHHIAPNIPHDFPTISHTTFPTTFPTISPTTSPPYRPPYRPRHHPPTRTLLLFPFGKGMPTISPTISPTTSPTNSHPPFVPFWKRDAHHIAHHFAPRHPHHIAPSFCSLALFQKRPKLFTLLFPFGKGIWKRDKKLKHNPPHNLHTISHTNSSSFCSLLEKGI